MLFETYVRFHILKCCSLGLRYVFYKYLSVILVFSHPLVYVVGICFSLCHFLIIGFLYVTEKERE